MAVFRQAMRRGMKRMQYTSVVERRQDEEEEWLGGEKDSKDPTLPHEIPEERVEPWVKRRRVPGPYGEGWERVTPERETDKRKQKEREDESVRDKSQCPQRFADINKRQVLISKFLVAVQERQDCPPAQQKQRTPVKERIRRLERKSREVQSPGKAQGLLRKTLKVKDKPGGVIQAKIRKFLISENKENKEDIGSSSSSQSFPFSSPKPKQPVRLGACGRSTFTPTSGRRSEPRTGVGGKKVREGGKERKRISGSLESWLLSEHVGAGETGAEAGEVRRGKEESVASGKGGTAVVREEEEER